VFIPIFSIHQNNCYRSQSENERLRFQHPFPWQNKAGKHTHCPDARHLVQETLPARQNRPRASESSSTSSTAATSFPWHLA
jgi:hypothetical protein